MENHFAFLNPDFFRRASVFPGSLGSFRYRFQSQGKRGDGSVQAWVYENVSFPLAQDVETETFPWTEEGVAALRNWLEERLAQRGWEPYRIPYGEPPDSQAAGSD